MLWKAQEQRYVFWCSINDWRTAIPGHYRERKKGRISKQTALNPTKNSRRPWAVIQGPRIYRYVFPLGLGPPLKIGKECCFSFGILFSCTGEQSGVEAGGGSWGFARHIWKVRKKGDGGDSHPAGCFACHSEESEAKFSPSRRQKILELWLTPALPGQMQYSSCVLLIPSLSLLTLVVYSYRHKETFKREMYCWVSVSWARALVESWSPCLFFLFYIALVVALRSSGLCAWRLNSLPVWRGKSEFQWKVKHTCQVACQRHNASFWSRTASPGILPWDHWKEKASLPLMPQRNMELKCAAHQARGRELKSCVPVYFLQGGNHGKQAIDGPIEYLFSNRGMF